MTETHNEGTLEKVRGALQSVGLDHTATIDAISTMQNEGILFREHEEEPEPALPVTCEVTIPLGSVTDMVRVLSSIPVTARITLRTAVVDYQGPAGVRILSEAELERTRPRLVALWDEVR